MRVLALDYGSARTGVAVSDATGTLARPVGVVERAATDTGLARLAELVAEHEAELVVVGLPLTLRGEHGEQARETEAFVDVLRGTAGRPRRDRTTSASRPRWRSRLRVARAEDAVAAAHLLQGWLERAQVRRGLALVGVAVVVAIGRLRRDRLGLAAAPRRRRPSRRRRPVRRRSRRLKIIFPEGFTVREMADRVAAVRQIAIDEARRDAACSRARRTSVQSAKAVAPSGFRKDAKRGSLEGFLFPALYEFTQDTSGERARRRPAPGVPRSAFAEWTCATRARRT